MVYSKTIRLSSVAFPVAPPCVIGSLISINYTARITTLTLIHDLPDVNAQFVCLTEPYKYQTVITEFS